MGSTLRCGMGEESALAEGVQQPPEAVCWESGWEAGEEGLRNVCVYVHVCVAVTMFLFAVFILGYTPVLERGSGLCRATFVGFLTLGGSECTRARLA